MITNEDLSGRLGTIEAIVTRLETRLLGNGQPGELDKIHTRYTNLDERLDKVERTEAKARGAFWTLSALISALGLNDFIKYIRT